MTTIIPEQAEYYSESWKSKYDALVARVAESTASSATTINQLRERLDRAEKELADPLDAPRDGTFILGSFGWPWLVPAVWNSYDDEWVVCHMQAQEMANGLDDRWLEMEREKATSLKGWLPVPPLP